MFIGVVFGLCAAFCQSVSYVFSTLFVRTFHRSALVLLALSHCLMGGFSLVLLPFVRPAQVPPPSVFVVPLVGASTCYLAGQACLFLALRHADASRVSPLLGLKLPILAGITVIILGQSYSVLQWCGLAVCLLAAWLLNEVGGRIPERSIMWVLGACVGYSFSDLNIRALVRCFSEAGLVRASLFSVCLSYTLCGSAGLLLLVFLPRTCRRMWWYALGFGAAWFAAMVFLFACFGCIDVVFGNIVQSTRGVISIGIGAAVAALGWVHVERRVRPSVIFRRALAAILMIVAIALFSLGSAAAP